MRPRGFWLQARGMHLRVVREFTVSLEAQRFSVNSRVRHQHILKIACTCGVLGHTTPSILG